LKDKTNIRLAVVDDEQMIRDVFASLLRQAGYRADFFSDPIEAYRQIIASPGQYDLLITDITMPGEDGIAFATRIRAVLPDLPVLFMTGGETETIRQRALQLGRVMFLSKPFPLADKLRDMILQFVVNG
jgi:CheY-like chemotaxis protein